MQGILSRILFWCSIVVLICLIASFWLFQTPGIDWSSNDLRDSFEQFRFLGIPFCILLTLLGTIRASDPAESIATKVVGTFLAAGFSFFLLFGTIFSGMCVWNTRTVLFEHVGDASLKIVERDFGCGAVDSGPPLVSVFETRSLTPFWVRYTPMDTTKIDPRQWHRVQQR